MLLRIQTLWILLSLIIAVSSFELPFAIVKGVEAGSAPMHIDAGSSVLLIVLTAFSVALSSLTIFHYNNLVRQKTLCWLGIMLGVVILLIFLKEWRSLQAAELSVTCLLPFLSPISLWLAWIGVKGDEKMLKNLGKRR